jgi:hypothetical protein
MGILTDAMRDLAPQGAVDQRETVPDAFGKGLRSGALQAGSMLANAGGAVAQGLGAQDFANGAFNEADQLKGQAAQAAPSVGSYTQVHGLRDALNYGAGVLGSSLPVAGAGLAAAAATDGAAIPAILAGTAATAPFEIGDVVGRQRAAGEDVDLGKAALAGGASALAQNIIPGLGRAKLAGKVARSSALAAIPEQAAAGTAGEAAKEMGTNGEVDPQQLKEAAVGGAVGAIPFAGLHAVGNARAAAGGAGDGARSALAAAASKVKDALQQRVGGAEESAPPAGEAPQGSGTGAGAAKAVSARFADLMQRAGQAKDDLLERFQKGESSGNPELDAQIAQAGADQMPELGAQVEKSRMRQAQDWANELLNDKGLSQEKWQQVAEAVKNLGNEGAQTTIAAIKAGRDRAKELAGKVGSLYDDLTSGAKDTAEAGAAQKSADYSGVRQTILDTVTPVLKERAPEIFDDPKALGQLGDSLRVVMDKATTDGQIPDSVHDHLQAIFGEDTPKVLQELHGAIADQGDETGRQNMFAALNRMDDRSTDLTSKADAVRKALPHPEGQGADYSDDQIRAISDALDMYAKGQHTAGMGPEEARYTEKQARRQLEGLFGGSDKLDSVLKAFEPQRDKAALDAGGIDRSASDLGLDEHADGEQADAAGLSETAPAATVLHDKPLPSPEAHRAQFGNESQAERIMREAEAKNPGMKARFVSPDEYRSMTGKDPGDVPKGQGFVVGESLKENDALTEGQRRAMQFDRTKGNIENSKSAIRVEGSPPFDAMKITRTMDASEPYTASDDRGRQYRQARMFMEGVAKLQEHLGKSFDIPDETQIAKGLTYGDVKKLKFGPDTGRDFTGELESLRNEYRDAKSQGASKAKLDDIVARAQKVSDARDESIISEGGTRKPVEDFLEEAGKTEADPFNDNIHVAKAALGEDGTYLKVGPDGVPLRYDTSASPEGMRGALDSIVKRMAEGRTAPARALAEKAGKLLSNFDALPDNAKGALTVALKSIKDQGKLSAGADTINGLAERFAAKAEAPKVSARVDALAAKENYESINTPAKAESFLTAAKSRLEELRSAYKAGGYEDLPNGLQKVMHNLEQLFSEHSDLRTFFTEAAGFNKLPQTEQDRLLKFADSLTMPAKEVPAQGPKALENLARSGDVAKAAAKETDPASLARGALHLAALKDASSPKVDASIHAINDRIGEIVKESPDAAYSMQTAARQGRITAQEKTDVMDYIHKTLGNAVQVAFKAMSHAGEYSRELGQDIIRVSVHALNPLSAAYHESMHALMRRLEDAGAHDVTSTLFRAAETAPVRRQLAKLLANEPEALKQLQDPYERAAYMYQFWADGKLKVGDGAKGVLGKIKDMILKTLGIWSNDQRALHIMEEFQRGEFAKAPGAFAHDVMEQGRSAALDKARAMTEPFARMADAVATAGGQRMRDTGIPALQQLADKMKLQSHGEGEDPGFIPAARVERTRMMNELGDKLAGFSKAHIAEALEALQKKGTAGSPEARLAARAVRSVLDKAYGFMKDAGVKVDDLGVGKDYFPRVYDPDYISRNQKAFTDVLEKHGINRTEANDILHRLITSDGNEFQVQTLKPGMQFAKERKLKNVPDNELAPFMKKDLHDIMNSYLTQAARRAEWARRFGDDGKGVLDLFAKAKAQGATKEQLDAADKFVRGVDGTLGDNLNPTARRLMGNMIVYQNIRLLPLAIFSSAVDPMGIIVRGGDVHDAWNAYKRGIKEIAGNFKRQDKDAATELAETLGTIDNAALVHSIGTGYSQGMVGATARKINDTFFRYNLMERFNQSMRVAATEAALKFIDKHADGSASPHSARWMDELGLKPSDVQRDVTGRVKLTEGDGLTPEQASKMRLAVNKWVDGAILRPDAADKPIWMNDPHFALIAHLKQFVYSFHETILKRVMHEYQNGNYTPAMALASYVPIMIAADMAKGMIQGGGSQPDWKDKWDAGDYVWSGVQRAGLLGTGQFIADGMGHAGIGALAGPTVEQLADAVDVLDGHEMFKHFLLKSMPANALYAGLAGGQATDPTFAD